MRMILHCTSLPKILRGSFLDLFFLCLDTLLLYWMFMFICFDIFLTFIFLCDSYIRSYKIWLDYLMKHDLALRGDINGVELLVFPSNQLPDKLQCMYWVEVSQLASYIVFNFVSWSIHGGKAS